MDDYTYYFLLNAEAHMSRVRRNTHADSIDHDGDARTPVPAVDIVAFWRAAGSSLWFAKDAEFDRRFRDRFLTLHEAAASGELADWTATPVGSLALIILLDQYPRNAFRGTPRMYGTDAQAREIAKMAVAHGQDRVIEPALRIFVYMPFAHSEALADQNRAVDLIDHLGGVNLEHARRHRDIIRRFGRFPHRNPLLDRPMTSEEQRYLDEGGYAG
ncbi:DUF924 family protein [Azospirillum largimobile]